MVKHIVIVGGGYAGATAAHWIARLGRQRSRVTLINERAEFSERVRMHQLASGKILPTRRLAELSARVRLIVGRVERVDPADRRVLLADGGTVSYDSLILAPGSGNPTSRSPVRSIRWRPTRKHCVCAPPSPAPSSAIR